jgi:hypothetical protein
MNIMNAWRKCVARPGAVWADDHALSQAVLNPVAGER